MLNKLCRIQSELKAPKGQYNSFGKYKYRSCEDILEGVKPLLAREKCTLTLSDEVFLIGDRFYIKATAVLRDCESDKFICNSALAREDAVKKGMDGSQITGTASSYARKYALNGLFCIDDTKDADTDEHRKTIKTGEEIEAFDKSLEEMATSNEKKLFLDMCKLLDVNYENILKQAGVTGQMTKEQHAKCMLILKEIEDGKGEK